MKTRLLYIIKIFLAYTAVFCIMKPIFMLYNHALYSASFSDYFRVVTGGLPLDLSTAGYLTGIPLLLSIISAWITLPHERQILRIYYGLTSFLLSVILLTDCALYSFWGFKLDATIFNYLDSPKNALASVSIFYLLLGVLCIFIVAAAIYYLLRYVTPDHFRKSRNAWWSTGCLVLLGGVLFLFIRGGVGKSTMNIGAVYFSNNQFLNHSAVNPAFSLISSSIKIEHLDHFYRFFPQDECDRRFAAEGYATESKDTPELLTTKHPNIVIVIFEGLGGTFVEPLGGEKGVTPQLNRLSREGIFFTQCYANSFRTDRGVVCTLSGYPSFPQFSVMKMPRKSRTLPSIARTLTGQGYRTEFLYGGDINFTNMNSYLLSTGYNEVYGDTHFPVSVRRTHAWGVTDRIAFDTLYQRILSYPSDRPWMTTMLTLASHEPWIVPYHRIKGNIRTNAMAYTDDCFGRLIARLKKTPQWKNLLIVCLPDHGIGYPLGLTEADKRRYHIPILWLGGAVKGPRQITSLCNQTDLAATLLGQLGLDHRRFTFSRDVLSSTYTRPFAIHTFDNGFAFIDASGYTVQDFNSGRILTDLPKPSKQRLTAGQVILQKTVEDLNKR